MHCDLHLLRPPTGFNFGIPDIPSNGPLSVPFVPLFGGGGRDGAAEVLLLPFASAIRPAPTGPLLSTVVVFFSFVPC